ncbi:unnamed protein product [Vicia faba]|uniref:F-box protein SKIP5 n=1 Tax=Vicia faba TaxID=3906 RepID=A0AAV0ZC40_VICFA|nr:unnamed protein product [Vicia faba]
MMVVLCTSLVSYPLFQIGLTPPSFATDGIIWHVILASGFGWIDRLKTYLNLVFSPNIETAVSASRPGDTILIAAGGTHRVANIQINKPLCLIGAGEIPDDTMLACSRGSDSALEFLSTCKLANLSVKAELGCCLLHRSGRLIIDGCLLQCESNPLDFLSCPIVSTACSSEVLPSQTKCNNGVFVSQTRIEGGAKAVLTSGGLALQRVRVVYARTSLLFWFDVEQMLSN